MRASEFVEDNFGTSPKRTPRSGSRPSRGHEPIPRYRSKDQGIEEQQKVGNMPADKFDDAMAQLKRLAASGPLKTVWDPQKRVYRNVPTAVQPKK